MRTWETVEISVHKIDVSDVISTSYGTTDTPLVGGDKNNSEDLMNDLE